MSVETTVTDELQIVASAVDSPPPPSVEALVRRAGRERTRTLRTRLAGTALVAAAMVAAIMIGTQIGKPSTSPQPSHPTPTRSVGPLEVGEPLKTYVDPDHATLYLDGVVAAGNWHGATTQGHATIGYPGEGGQGSVGVIWGTHLVGMLHHVAGGQVVASRDGRAIAWMEAAGGSVHLVVAEVTADSVRELGRTELDPVVLETDNEASEQVISVDDRHTVTYGGVIGGHSWAPGHAPKDADISTFLTRPDGFPDSFYPPQLNLAGTWGAWPTDREGRGRHDDADDPYAAITVQRPNRPDTRFTFTRPTSEGPLQWMYWETDEDLIVAEAGDTTRPATYLRCNVVEQRCEVAPTPDAP